MKRSKVSQHELLYSVTRFRCPPAPIWRRGARRAPRGPGSGNRRGLSFSGPRRRARGHALALGVAGGKAQVGGERGQKERLAKCQASFARDLVLRSSNLIPRQRRLVASGPRAFTRWESTSELSTRKSRTADKAEIATFGTSRRGDKLRSPSSYFPKTAKKLPLGRHIRRRKSLQMQPPLTRAGKA